MVAQAFSLCFVFPRPTVRYTKGLSSLWTRPSPPPEPSLASSLSPAPRRSPVDRVTKPLAQMGANIEARDGRYPPLIIHGRPLHGIEYTPPVASAQVKSSVLLAGLFATGETVVHESVRTRDHTEIALQEFGA